MSKEAALASLTGTSAPVTQNPTSTTTTDTTASVTSQANKSDAFAHLAKKEEAIVKERLQLKQDREAAARERAEAQAIIKKEQDFEAMKKTDVISALKSRGFSEQDIFNYLADKQPVELTPEEKAAKAAEAAADAKIKAWEENQAKAKAEEAAKRDQGLISGFKDTIGKTITADKDKYEYCAHYGAVAEALIYETVLADIRESKGKNIMSAKEAIELVEQYYEDEDKAMSTLKKRSPTPAAAKEPVSTERIRTVTDVNGEPVKQAQTRTRTLSNGATATAASIARRANETKEQKRERLIESLRQGKLA